MKHQNRKKSRHTDRPTLPELDQTKKPVLNSLASLQSRRSRYAKCYGVRPRKKSEPQWIRQEH